MDLHILNLSESEHNLVQRAQQEFGPEFKNAHDLVFFTWSFVASIKPEALAFTLFLSQFQKSLALSFLSALRYHEIQFHLMLRYALESVCLGCYALHDHDIESFGKADVDEILDSNKRVSNKAYKWLQENYRTFSDKIKTMKNQINENFAHANILPTPYNIYVSNGQIGNMFFDEPDSLIMRQHLWWVANVALGMMDLFSQVIQKLPLARLVEDFPEKMTAYGSENERIKKELMQNPRLSRWKDKVK